MTPVDTALNAALRRLPAGDRALLELSLRRGVPDDQIASLLSLTSAEVVARRERLLEALAADAGVDGPEPAGAVAAALRGSHAVDWSEQPHEPRSGEPEPQPPRPEPRFAHWREAAPHTALLLLPGALTAYLGFTAGGYFPDGTAVAALLLCLALLLRVTLAERPAAGLGIAGGSAAALIAGFAVWMLLSAAWSDATGRALIEFDRALLYLLACALFATVPRSARNLRVMLWGFAAAASAVCLVGLASRVLPELVPTARNIANERLAYPVTYWNALGMLAALGLLACFHLAASEREPRVARILGAAAFPGLAVTLFFTFSRGAIVVLAITIVAYAVAARPRGLLSGVLATLPPTAVALAVAYGADRLSTENPTAASAAGQANRVALVTALAIVGAGLLRLVLLRLDGRLGTLRMAERTRRLVLGGSAAALLLVVAATALALDAPREIGRQYDRFTEGGEVETGGDARRRLTNPANNGRLDHWRVALEVFREDRLKGQGAGTYEIAWARERPVEFEVLDAHSLYLETLAELGVVGLVLLGGALIVLLMGLAWRIRGPDRALYAALAAMALAWILRAGADWDWEMPVITLWLFAIGAAALARPEGVRPLFGEAPRLARLLAGLAVLAVAVTPALVYLSEVRLDRGAESFERGHCARAVDQALRSTSALSVRAEPFEILGYCDVRLGRPRLAVRAMEAALERDPRAWRLHYGLALVRGAAGLDPRAAARSALRLNPRDPLTRAAVRRFRTNDPQKWKRRALSARLPID